MLKAMRALTNLIEVTVDEPAFISGFDDMKDRDSGNHFEPGHVCEVVGRKIKIEGDPVKVGLWPVPVTDSTKRVQMTRIVDNGASRIQFIPVATGFSENRIEIRTSYSGSGSGELNSPRSIASPFTITQV